MPNGRPPVPPPPTNGSQHEQVHAAKKQTKWTPPEDHKIIMLRANGMKWEDISMQLPGRSAISCRLHYQNYLEKRQPWDEDMKNKLARLYDRFKEEMWNKIAGEMTLPWRSIEAMHWQLGAKGMAERAGVTLFELADQGEGGEGSNRSPQRSHQAPATAHYPREVAPTYGGHHHHGHSRSHSLSTMPVGQGGPGRDSYPQQSHQPLAPASRHPHAQYQGHPSLAHAPAPAAVAAAAAAMAAKNGPRSPYPLPPRGSFIKQEPTDDYIKTEYYEQTHQQAAPTGPGLAPIQSAPRPGGRDMLPSIRELTSMPSPHESSESAARGPSAPSAGQGYGGAGYTYQARETTGHKRRSSVDVESREAQRRRLG